MATIKRSELNALKQDYADVTEDRDFWQAEWRKRFDDTCDGVLRIRDLKNKLWAAEQEIHDLKKIVETEHEDIQKLTNQVIDLLVQATKPLEQIEVPSCLKPKDALHYAANQVFYSPTTTTVTVPQNKTTWIVNTFSY